MLLPQLSAAKLNPVRSWGMGGIKGQRVIKSTRGGLCGADLYNADVQCFNCSLPATRPEDSPAD